MQQKKELSILIPTYNDVCTDSVNTLMQQAESIGDLRFEIIVADDASTDENVVEANRAIDRMTNCRYIRRENNVGRAAIRNFLAQEARYEWLLFVDSGMGIVRSDFIFNYLQAEGNPIYGGYVVEGDAENLRGNLRFRYEKANEPKHTLEQRLKQPEQDFHTSNFLVSRSLFLQHPLDERFRRYGYEDVLWGKRLKEDGIAISHIDNPVAFDRFETNEAFLHKTEESLSTLHLFSEELKGYSRLLTMARRLKTLHLSDAVLYIYKMYKQKWLQNLLSNEPSLTLFKFYKLGRFLEIGRSTSNSDTY